MSVVRSNLMEREGYRPYCGNVDCRLDMPRSHYLKGQFRCGCGWSSSFEPEFIAAYEAKWTTPTQTEPTGGQSDDA